MATDTISVTVISRRLSFFDKLSAFGNNSLLYVIYQMCVNRHDAGGILGLFFEYEYPQHGESGILGSQIHGQCRT